MPQGDPRLATTATPKSRKSSTAAPAKGKAAGAGRAAAARGGAKSAAKSAAKKPAAAGRPKTAPRAPARAAAKAGLAKPATVKKAPAAPARQAAAAKKTPAPRKAKSTLPTDPVERLRLEVRRALEELKARDVTEIDVRGKTSIADYLVIASGTSNRHVKSIADEVVKYAKKAGSMPLGVEGQREAEWVLVDLGDLVVHVMLPRVREFYGLERLWTVGAEQIEALRA